MNAPLLANFIGAAVFLIASNTSGLMQEYSGNEPLIRVIDNLTKRVEASPDDAQLQYTLGRAHGLAYAWGSTDNPISYWDNDSGNMYDLNAFHHYAGPAESWVNEMHRGQPPIQREDNRHLLLAIKHVRRALQLEPTWDHFRLTFAWLLEEGANHIHELRLFDRDAAPPSEELNRAIETLASSDTFDEASDIIESNILAASPLLYEARKDPALPEANATEIDRLLRLAWEEAALTQYRRIFEPAAEQLSRRSMFDAVAVEAGNSIKIILQSRGEVSTSEKQEIWDISKTLGKMADLPRAVTPLIFQLTDANTSLLAPDTRVRFNLDGLGRDVAWPWVAPETYLLVWDPADAGDITSDKQLFGSVTWWLFWRDGFEPLAALDDNGDGWLRGGELRGIAAWQDANSNGISDAGEVKPLAALGFTAIATEPQGRNDGMLWHPHGLQRVDGRPLPLYDWEPTGFPLIQSN